MPVAIRVLIVEDSEDDALLLLRELKKGGYEPKFRRVDTPEAMEKAIVSEPWDIVIADYAMPRFNGLAALKILQDKGPDIPFILTSGTVGEDTAVKAMKAGAHDYIMKDNLTRLVSAVERELKEAEVRRSRREAEDELRSTKEFLRLQIERMPIGCIMWDHDFRGDLVEPGRGEYLRVQGRRGDR